jgi:hypothetical protein
VAAVGSWSAVCGCDASELGFRTNPRCVAISAGYAAGVAVFPPKALSLLPSALIDALLSSTKQVNRVGFKTMRNLLK